MLDHEYDTMRKVEDTNWWYGALREFVADELTLCIGVSKKAAVLDAGCGTGGMLEKLKQTSTQWNLDGADISPIALDHARERGIENLTACSVDALPMADATFDAVVSLDVLYHSGLDDDKGAGEFARVLKPGGFLVLNLPAFSCLTGSHDVAVSGARRYSAAQVRRLLEKHGLRILQLHYWNAWLFPLIFVWRQVSRLFQNSTQKEVRSDLSPLPASLNSLLTWLTRTDMRLSRALRIPFGTSVFAVAVKR